MSAAAAVFAHNAPRITFKNVATETAEEVSSLLLCAIRCVEKDETIAIDLMKQASSLLKPFSIAVEVAERPRNSAGGLAPWQINRVKNYIEDRISHPIALDELAQVAKLSTSYFSAAFKVTFGISPHNYVVERRVEFAKYRMLNSDAPLCEIALDCGLADQAHLSRIFRRVTGTTPSAWRRYVASPESRAAAA
ncbi:helix-turn-helix transcriptional regulator [Rhizobium sp. P40RR-XXII]|uniref:helix-turn-helix domain-containing protein n=1 Tax=unclassified Rhizobium TaxID=2613769 RepID=UPI0014575FD7|nr:MULTISPECIES: AraC family transcriptional regulator [unclassified Rhizobium]NLR85991.1 helix-turn-helix transcriptional regulator [Rhizobium sp. P28RR-XV]NLS18855.1 helix-turn-helix transcriptional regulator [Rhizobium sp. P40RR-XXII]